MSEAILGISAYYHDSAAALIVDGDIVAAAHEERFTRKKQDSGFPVHAVNYVLDEAGLQLSDINAVVFYDKPYVKFERLLETYHSFAPRGLKSFLSGIPVWIKEKLLTRHNLRKELEAIGGLVGRAYGGAFSNIYTTGSVVGGSYTGGLIGYSWSDISNVYTTGSVTGGASTGGLVGYLYSATISSSYSTATVAGTTDVGGLVGYSSSFSGNIVDSYAAFTTAPTGTSEVGGLVGDNDGSMTNDSGYCEYTSGTTISCSDEYAILLQASWSDSIWGNITASKPALFALSTPFPKSSTTC